MERWQRYELSMCSWGQSGCRVGDENFDTNTTKSEVACCKDSPQTREILVEFAIIFYIRWILFCNFLCIDEREIKNCNLKDNTKYRVGKTTEM